jgi:acyl carrier protein
MKREEVYEKLTGIFRDVFDDPNIQLKPDMTARDITDWDSSNHINLILAAEARFGVHFNLSEVESMQAVSDFVDLIQKRLAA